MKEEKNLPGNDPERSQSGHRYKSYAQRGEVKSFPSDCRVKCTIVANVSDMSRSVDVRPSKVQSCV